MNSRIRIVIADDHAVFRTGLRFVIEADEKFKVVAEAANGGEALSLIKEHLPDILVSDISMPVLNGFEVVQEINPLNLMTRTIFLTMHAELDLFRRAKSLGVKGYLLKDHACDDIIKGLSAVSAGMDFSSQAANPINAGMPAPTPHPDELTRTEKAVLTLVGEYKTSKEIGELLFISHRTVENHRTNICSKLHITGRHALARYAKALAEDQAKLAAQGKVDRRKK